MAAQKRPKSAGNTRAQKGSEAASAVLHIRCTPTQKNAYVRAAQADGKKTSEWALAHLDQAAK
jgi:uncharacterized protein (DUF1778 family)